jgi:hypothetical protein
MLYLERLGTLRLDLGKSRHDPRPPRCCNINNVRTADRAAKPRQSADAAPTRLAPDSIEGSTTLSKAESPPERSPSRRSARLLSR